MPREWPHPDFPEGPDDGIFWLAGLIVAVTIGSVAQIAMWLS